MQRGLSSVTSTRRECYRQALPHLRHCTLVAHHPAGVKGQERGAVSNQSQAFRPILDQHGLGRTPHSPAVLLPGIPLAAY